MTTGLFLLHITIAHKYAAKQVNQRESEPK